MNARLFSIAATAALALGLVAAPAAAVGTTTYVDDDGAAGAAGCNGALTVSATIQAAVDASGPGDTILVCPGTYAEQVVVEGAAHRGLTIRATDKWQARISPTALDGPEGADSIVKVSARNVTLLWLKLVARTSGTCEQVEHAVHLSGADGAVVRGLRIAASRTGDTLTGPCGYQGGIYVNGGEGVVLWHNQVRDFRVVGVFVYGSTGVAVRNTSVQFWHLADCPQSANVCASRIKRAPAGDVVPTGIGVNRSTGVVSHNVVTRGPEDQPVGRGTFSFAYSLFDDEGLRFVGNRSYRVLSGLAATNVSGGVIRDNLFVGTLPPVPVAAAGADPAAPPSAGLQISASTGVRARDNRVAWFGNGLYVFSTTDSTFRGNDATGNLFNDCVEVNPTAGVGPVNTWIDNLGNTDSPSGLCTDAPVTPLP